MISSILVVCWTGRSEGLLVFEKAAGSFHMMFGSMLAPRVPTTPITNAT
jgi:hypothetical protein